jgi:hypothetical protein
VVLSGGKQIPFGFAQGRSSIVGYNLSAMRIVVCIVLVLLSLTQKPAKKPDGNDTQGQNKADSLREAQAPVTVNCNQSTGAVADHHESDAPKWYASIEWANWLLVLVAAGTGYAIWLQTKATRVIAVATLRPKLNIRGIALVQGTLVPVVDGTQVVEDAMAWQIECLIANVGGSVAHVTESNLTVATIDIQDRNLPVFPPYGASLNWLDKCDISPGEHKQIMAELGESNTMAFRILAHMHRGGGHVISNRFCLGFIQYRDDAKVERRTAFCFRYHVGTQSFERITEPNYDYAD